MYLHYQQLYKSIPYGYDKLLKLHFVCLIKSSVVYSRKFNALVLFGLDVVFCLWFIIRITSETRRQIYLFILDICTIPIRSVRIGIIQSWFGAYSQSVRLLINSQVKFASVSEPNIEPWNSGSGFCPHKLSIFQLQSSKLTRVWPLTEPFYPLVSYKKGNILRSHGSENSRPKQTFFLKNWFSILRMFLKIDPSIKVIIYFEVDTSSQEEMW